MSVEYLVNVVGDKPLCCVRSPKNGMHLRVFVSSNDEVIEVTAMVAKVCSLSMTRNREFITFKGGGYSPVQSLAEHYAMAMKKNDQKYIDLH